MASAPDHRRPGRDWQNPTKAIAEEDWDSAWKEHYQVTHLGRHVVIKPTWREYAPQGDEVVVELDPGMAFGTGLHPTTRNCGPLARRRDQITATVCWTSAAGRAS